MAINSYAYVLPLQKNIDIYNNSSLGADITNYETSGTYTKEPSILGTLGAKAEVYVST